MANIQERRKTFPADVWESLKYYAEDEKKRVSPEIQNALTPEAFAWEILKNHLTKVGHYPPKSEKVVAKE